MNPTALPACTHRAIDRIDRSGAAIDFDARRVSVHAAIDASESSLAAILVNRHTRFR